MSGTRVLDGRRLPFSMVTHLALDVIRAEFVGPERSSAMSLYLALEARSSKERGRGGDGGVETTKTEIGEEAGLSPKTVELVAKRFVSIGVLEVDHRPGRPNLWTLVEPGENEPEATPAMEAAGDPPAQSSRDTRAVIARHPRNDCAGPVKALAGRAGRSEEKEEREIAPARRICDRLEQHVRSIDPQASVDSTSWSTSANSLLSEGREVDDVLAVIDWLIADPFWSSRVLSPSALQRNYTKLLAARTMPPLTGRGGIDHQRQRKQEERRANAGVCCLEHGAAPAPAEDEWRRIAASLHLTLGDTTFGLWFGAGHAHAGSNGELLLALPEVVGASVRARYGDRLAEAAGRRVEIVNCDETP